MTNQQNETTFTEGVRPLVFGEFIGSAFDTEKRDIPEGFYTTPRAVYHGPLALTQVGVMKATEEDLTMYWEEVDTGGEHRIQMAYMDIIRVEPASLLILLILAGGLLLGAVYGLLTLLGTGIAALWRRRKKPAAQIKHSGYRKWNLRSGRSRFVCSEHCDPRLAADVVSAFVAVPLAAGFVGGIGSCVYCFALYTGKSRAVQIRAG